MNRLAGVVLALLCAFFVPSLRAESPRGTFRNPLNPSADPWLGFVDGFYYLATTQGDCIRLWKARSLADLAKASPLLIWERGQGVWAPEFHQLRGPNGRRWYCYFTKTDGPDDHHRL